MWEFVGYKQPLPGITGEVKERTERGQRLCLWCPVSNRWCRVFGQPRPRIQCHLCRPTLRGRMTLSSLQSSGISHPSPRAISSPSLASQFSLRSGNTLLLYVDVLKQTDHGLISPQKTHARESNPRFFTAHLTWEAFSGGLGRWLAAQSILTCFGLLIQNITSSKGTLDKKFQNKILYYSY